MMTNIFNCYSYNTNDDNELDRKRNNADDTLLKNISNGLININNSEDMYQTLKQYDLLKKYGDILINIENDNGINYNISNNLSLKETKKNKWIYDYTILSPINNFSPYITKQNKSNINYIDISHFFNNYIQRYYGKIKYFKKYYEKCIIKKINGNNIFVYKLKLCFGGHKIALIYPLDHKKLKNIIVIMKVIQIQLTNIMNEIIYNTSLQKLFNKKYSD